MKGSALHNYSLKCSCTIPELHQHSLSLAPHWRCLSESSGTLMSRNTFQRPTEPGQIHPESWAVLSTLSRCRDTPNPTPAPQVKPLHTASSEEPSPKSFCFCFTCLPCWQDRDSFRTKSLDFYDSMCSLYWSIMSIKPLMENLQSTPQGRDLHHV